MTAEQRRVFAALLGVLTERFTGSLHVKAQIEHEHRGHCTVRGCGATCIEYRALLIEASEMLERELRGEPVAVEAPVQGGLFDETEVAG